MKTNRFIWLVCIVVFGAISCQKSTKDDSEENMEENNPETMFEDKVLIGSWAGTLQQIGYPSVSMVLSLSLLEQNKKSGEVNIPGSCTTELTYSGKNGKSFNFKEDVLPGSHTDCIGGTSYLIIKSKDTINYNWTGEDNANNTANALLVRK
jgi:hypothetical protein